MDFGAPAQSLSKMVAVLSRIRPGCAAEDHLPQPALGVGTLQIEQGQNPLTLLSPELSRRHLAIKLNSQRFVMHSLRCRHRINCSSDGPGTPVPPMTVKT